MAVFIIVQMFLDNTGKVYAYGAATHFGETVIGVHPIWMAIMPWI